MKKDASQEIIIHKNQSNIFDIIGKEEDNSIEDTTQPLALNVEEKSIKIKDSIPYFKDNFPNLKLINVKENQYLAFDRGMTYYSADFTLYLRKNKNKFLKYSFRHNALSEVFRARGGESQTYKTFLFDSGLCTMNDLCFKFDEDEIDKLNIYEILDEMSNL